MQQQPGSGQFGGSNQPNYFMPTPSPYQQQQGTPMSFVHSPGSAIEPSPGGGVYPSMHQQQLPSQQLYQYMAPSPAQSSELSRQLGFGSAPPSVGSPMAAGAGSGYRSQPPSLQSHMLPPTPQPATPRGPQTPASVGPIGSVGGDYNVHSVGGPGSVNPATPRSVGEPLSVSDVQQQQPMAPKSVPMSGSSYVAALLDQDSNSQMDSPQPQQQQQQNIHQHQQQQAMGVVSRNMTISSSLSNQGLNDGSVSASSATGRTHSMSSAQLAGSSATMALQNLEQYGPLALCSMGKELTQELVNRVADMFSVLRMLTDPGQHFPKSAIPEQQLNEREKRLSEHVHQITMLVHRLTAICIQLEQLSKTRLPPDAINRVQELLPFMDQITQNESQNGDHMEMEKSSFLDEIRQQAEQREEFQVIRVEHEKIKQRLIKKREHLREIMEFLREFCWQISMVLESNSS